MLAAFPHQKGSVSGDAHQHVFSLDAGQAGVVPPVAHGYTSAAFPGPGRRGAARRGASHVLSALMGVGLRNGVSQPHLKLIAAQRCVPIVADEAVQAVKHQVVSQVEASGT